MGPLNTRSLTDVLQQVRERAPPKCKGKFLVETKPNNKRHKMCRQFMKPRESPRADSAIELNMKKMTCHADAKKMVNGHDTTVSGLYRIAGVDWFSAEEEQFSSVTTLLLADLEGLPETTLWDH